MGTGINIAICDDEESFRESMKVVLLVFNVYGKDYYLNQSQVRGEQMRPLSTLR